MNNYPYRNNSLKWLVVAAIAISFQNLNASEIMASAEHSMFPKRVTENVDDYSQMWWNYGIKDDLKIFSIQTSRFAMKFDYLKSQTQIL